MRAFLRYRKGERMGVTVLQGDMRDVLASMPDAHFDCIITDPPYGETSLQWDRWPEGWPALVRRVLKPTGSSRSTSLRRWFGTLARLAARSSIRLEGPAQLRLRQRMSAPT